MKAILKFVILLSITAVFVVGCSSEEAASKQENDNQKQQQLETQEEQPTSAENLKSDDEKETKADLTDKEAAVSHGEEVSKEQADKDVEQTAQAKHQSTAAKPQAAGAKATATKQSDQEAGQNLATKKAATTSQTSQAKAQATQQPKQGQNSDVKKQEVSISIKGDDEMGVILKSTKVAYESGDTVLDLLKKVTKQNKIQMEYQGSGGTAYIEGIQNLYEFDKGPKSGWMYSVNGVFAKKGAGLAEVKPGDTIEWVYTLDLGKDVGASVNE